MTAIDSSKELVHSHLTVTRAAAWMADWSTYVDEPDYQDPEVAVAHGYQAIPLPPGSLSGAALAAEALPLDALRAGRVCRRWEGGAPVVVGTPLRARIRAGFGTLTTRFEARDGTKVATEWISVVESPLVDEELAGEAATFETGPVDLTRVRAMSWSLGEIDPDRQWSWGEEPEAVQVVGLRLVAPALVAARAVVSGKDAARAIAGFTVVTTAAPADLGATLKAEVVGRDGDDANVAIRSDGRLLASVVVNVRA